jgi:hypothetical protein
MKTFEVELKRESFITLTVEANSQDEAEAKAWKEVEQNYPNINDSNWEVASITEGVAK